MPDTQQCFVNIVERIQCLDQTAYSFSQLDSLIPDSMMTMVLIDNTYKAHAMCQVLV